MGARRAGYIVLMVLELIAFPVILYSCMADTGLLEPVQAGNAETGIAVDGYLQVDQDEAAEMMSSRDGYIILDVRTPEEFASGHIPDAINIPVEDIGEAKPAELPEDGQLIMVYCRSGNRSKTASAKLAAMGYTQVVEFGGINTWEGEIVR